MSNQKQEVKRSLVQYSGNIFTNGAKDEIVWDVIGSGSCKYARKTTDPNKWLCTSPYSVNGICDRISCPLANSEYNTIIEENGRVMLAQKVVERQHMPSKQWEKTELPLDYVEAYKLVKQKLQYEEPYVQERCLLKMRKLREANINRRRIAQRQTGRVKIQHRKIERREKARQAKALKAANIERNVQKELLSLLQQGKYKVDNKNVKKQTELEENRQQENEYQEAQKIINH